MGGTAGTILNNGGGAAALTVGNSGAFSGLIADNSSGAGTVALLKTGTGTLTLGGTNSYSGGTTVSGGVLQLGSSAALGNAALPAVGAYPLGVVTGGTLDLHGYSPTVGALTGNSGSLIGNLNGSTSGTLTINTAANTTFAGSIVDTGGMTSLVKTGSGSLALTGTSSYIGTTSINAGTLVVTSITPVNGASPLGNPSASSGTINMGSAGPATLQLVGTSTATLTTRVINLQGPATIDASEGCELHRQRLRPARIAQRDRRYELQFDACRQ